ncbi:unnamed protein product [Phyllotreta striolata]|uniref:PIN domain-containing protein n=1 Tax=Phyllotreta striolata TaxID=444603 RepID=A0A9N9U290_PHYSR|nr:unnamed protein product [Phyllotreta striolata]
MRRAKPQQPIYRPGSGPLKKSNANEESEFDSTVLKHKDLSNTDFDNTKTKSEGNSPRHSDRTSKSGDYSPNDDVNKRPRKPDQIIYVPRPIAQARDRESYPSQDMNRNTFAHINGNEKPPSEPVDRIVGKRTPYAERNMDKNEQGNDWREEAARQKQIPEIRGGSAGPQTNWTRQQRDNRGEKVQAKPPSGRRHSTVGAEQEKRFNNLPPRFQKKFLEDNKFQHSPVEDNNWDGSSLTFQKNQNQNHNHPTGGYYTLPYAAGSHHQHQPNANYISNTLPSKPRGRGRLYSDQETSRPGGAFESLPDKLKSPGNSRPPTPPSRPQTPTNSDNRRSTRPQDKRDNSQREFRNRRDNKNYNRDNFNNRDNYNARDHYRDQRWEDDYRDSYYKDRNNFKRNDYNKESGDGNRRERDQRRGGANQSRDKRRNGRRDRRSRSKETNRDARPYHSSISTDVSVEENWNLEEPKKDVVSRMPEPVRDRPESSTSPDDYKTLIPNLINNTLDWSEEVELNDRLESEYNSDALTRSSSIVSLQEPAMKSLPPNINETNTSKKKRRNRQRSRNRSNSRTRSDRTRQNSTTSIDSRDGAFRMPRDGCSGASRRSSRDRRDSSYDRYHNSSRNVSRDSSWDRYQVRGQPSGTDNWREEIERTRKNSDKDSKVILDVDPSNKKPGVLVLPQQKNETKAIPSLSTRDQPRYPDTRRATGQQHKSLFDPNNPSKPIIVKSTSSRVNVPGAADAADSAQQPPIESFGPPWYDDTAESFKSCHYPELLRDVRKADDELRGLVDGGWLLARWDAVETLRGFLKEALEYLLCKAMKFCQKENVEQHFWNVLYHNIIEVARSAIKSDPGNKEKYKGFLLCLIDEGSKYYERLLTVLEETYDFKLNNFMKENPGGTKGLGMVGLALVCAQKLFLFLGDLGRYREEVNETANYGKCRQWYIKSQDINPKNGKPYNQLAILAYYARRKLDAVYYYMRSLMSSNPVPSAKQNLVSLFYENKKKYHQVYYDQGEKKRREERLERQRQQMKQKESEDSNHAPGQLRRETWIHPEGGRRVYRTTQANLDAAEEDLSSLSSVEVNKRFVISYLHVLGKLITKIGMESFQEAAMQMLKEFRALLQHSPVPIPCNRLLQLLALNMYAIDTTQLKDPAMLPEKGYRSELQERALVVSLQMFDLILERCVAALQEHAATRRDAVGPASLPSDANVLLPAVKIWCDWLLCHTSVWNPPPSTQDFKVGSPGDSWSRLAALMNLLERMDQSQAVGFVKNAQEGFELIRLPEDSVLSGFTPLMYTSDEAAYAPKDVDVETAHLTQRVAKLLFFGTVYLCGVDPPVLKLEIEDGVREYVSVVCASSSRDSPPHAELSPNNDVLLESFSDDDADDKETFDGDDVATEGASTAVRELLSRKVELEKTKRSQDLHKERVKKILSQSVVSVHVEVRPRYLVPDTNCFIDHTDGIRAIAQSHSYTLMVPIIVLSELEGLSRGGKAPAPDSRDLLDPEHVKKVAASAKDALEFLKKRHASVKCVTTKGVILPSTSFSTEDDATWDNGFRNDDKILATCIGLCKGYKETAGQEAGEGEPRHLVREVVLLTEDRNLRVKAYARDVPVRELPDFMRWAGLG